MTASQTQSPARSSTNLSGFSPEALIDAIVRLTHAIHGSRGNQVRADELRARRSVARAELLRRIGPE